MAHRRRLSRPLASTRVLVSHRRNQASDYVLASILAFIAGAANAGGFFALGQYTSHMTGYLSQIPDNLVGGNLSVAGTAVLAIAAFTTGAAFSSLLINWARGGDSGNGRKHYAIAIAAQGFFLLCFATGGILSGVIGRLFALTCLCFIMGMQNATITKISYARVRTTHATGMITDIGIELGRVFSLWLFPGSGAKPDRIKLKILLTLVTAFLIGGIIGAIGFSVVGFLFALPLALTLLVISVPGLRPVRRHA